MYTLYYLPGACSLAIHALINELGQEVKLENVSVPQGEPRSPEFLKVNPRGQVPVLVDGDLVLREGGAIINYLLDKHNSNMLPKSQPERAQSLEWLMFANATLHPAYARIFFINRIIKDENAKEEAINAGIEQINKLWAEVDQQLAKTKYTCGDQITGADILLTVIANWIGYLPKPVQLGDNTKRMLKEIINRPAFKKALSEEKIEYKAV